MLFARSSKSLEVSRAISICPFHFSNVATRDDKLCSWTGVIDFVFILCDAEQMSRQLEESHGL
jgi:hypothetical protein